MGWFLASIISAVTLSGQALAYQRLQKRHPINVYMAYVWLGAALLLAIVFLRPADFPSIGANIVPLALAGLTSLVGNYTYNRAIRLQSNIGYIEAVISARIALNYLASIVFFTAPFEGVKLIGIVLIVYGVFTVGDMLKLDRREFRLDWLSWALASCLMFALLTIFVRFALDGGVRPEIGTVMVLFIAGMGFLAACGVNRTRVLVQPSHLPAIGVAIAFATVGNAVQFYALQNAPNLAYALAIDNTRMIILYVVGLVAFSEQIQRNKALGIVITFVGVILLS